MSASIGNNNPSSFKVEGAILAERYVHYEVYIVNKDSTLKALDNGKTPKDFIMEFKVGNCYLIKFTSPKNEVKYLHVDACIKGHFIVDVDFNQKGSAKLSYNKKESKYQIITVDTEQLQYGKKRKV
jgi:hypothetical protein